MASRRKQNMTTALKKEEEAVYDDDFDPDEHLASSSLNSKALPESGGDDDSSGTDTDYDPDEVEVPDGPPVKALVLGKSDNNETNMADLNTEEIHRNDVLLDKSLNLKVEHVKEEPNVLQPPPDNEHGYSASELLNHVKDMGSGQTNQNLPKTSYRANVIPESLNQFQTAASNLLSSFGGNPFASLFAGSAANYNMPSSFPGTVPNFDDSVNPLLGQYNLMNNIFSPNYLNSKIPFDFNRFLANPAVESLYRAILGDVAPPYAYPGENLQNTPLVAPGRGVRLPSTSRRVNMTVPQLWLNSNVKMNQIITPHGTAEAAPEPEEEPEDEDMAVAETYADYKPAKLEIGKRHPDPVIETASMASVLPPEVTLELNLPDNIIRLGKLSALQLEAVTYACQQHEFNLRSGVRSGYLIGDGAGVGKGRTIAGIIYENWLQDRKKSLWISVSADLKYDSVRDLSDIGATMIKVHPLNKLKYGKITSFNEGVIFATYSALIGESSQHGKYSTRLKQLVNWCGKNFDGVIVFDECHRAKNLCPTGSSKPTKTGKTVHELQEMLPRARIVYASATGASEPRNMAYMTRLGIWGEGTPFQDFQAFISSVEKRGVGAMEIVAMDMKLRGAYIARQLSFQGVTFNIEEVQLADQAVKVYDDSVALWVETMQKFIEAIELMNLEKRKRKAIWAQFWAAHQRFFKYLCIAAKVSRAVQIARDAVKDGKCVVIGLQSTGEARTLEQLERDEGELTDFVSTAKGVLQTLVEKHFPGPVPYNSRRISDLVGNTTGTSEMFDTFYKEMQEEKAAGNGGASSSSGKRKPVRRAAQNTKRVRYGDSDDEDSDGDADSDFDVISIESDPVTSDGSDYENVSEESISSASESEGEEESTSGKRKKSVKGPSTKRVKTSSGSRDKSKPAKPSKAAKQAAYDSKAKLLDKIEKLGEKLPPNTLDQLIDELGGPTEVAEMTGRKGRVIQDDQGNVSYEARSEADVNLESINLAEKERFMKGEKYLAIISEAASSGISLQSDRRVKNQRRRVHITLELPWSADRAIQQFGRTHRSNQVNAPEYVFLISDLAGEHRFASIVAKRLESLGALTHGDRRATESRDLSRYHIDNKYGRMALENVMRGILKKIPPMLPPPADYVGDFFADIAGALVGVGLIINSDGYPDLDKDFNNMSKFLNRILGMPVRLQNHLFKYFTDTLNYVIKQAKKTGRFDVGILDLSDNGSNEIIRTRKDTYERQHATGIGTIDLHQVKVERGISWEQIMEKYKDLSGGPGEGFYLAKQVRNNKRLAVFAISDSSSAAAAMSKTATYSVYRPNTGLQARRELLREIRDKYDKVDTEKAKASWEDQYTSSKTVCVHAYWSGNCKNRIITKHCDQGLRQRTYHILSGSVLLVWGIIENVFQSFAHGPSAPKMQVVRIRFSEDDRIVGVLIPNYCADELRQKLAEGAVSSNSQGMGEPDEKGNDSDNPDDFVSPDAKLLDWQY